MSKTNAPDRTFTSFSHDHLDDRELYALAKGLRGTALREFVTMASEEQDVRALEAVVRAGRFSLESDVGVESSKRINTVVDSEQGHPLINALAGVLTPWTFRTERVDAPTPLPSYDVAIREVEINPAFLVFFQHTVKSLLDERSRMKEIAGGFRTIHADMMRGTLGVLMNVASALNDAKSVETIVHHDRYFADEAVHMKAGALNQPAIELGPVAWAMLFGANDVLSKMHTLNIRAEFGLGTRPMEGQLHRPDSTTPLDMTDLESIFKIEMMPDTLRAAMGLMRDRDNTVYERQMPWVSDALIPQSIHGHQTHLQSTCMELQLYEIDPHGVCLRALEFASLEPLRWSIETLGLDEALAPDDESREPFKMLLNAKRGGSKLEAADLAMSYLIEATRGTHHLDKVVNRPVDATRHRRLADELIDVGLPQSLALLIDMGLDTTLKNGRGRTLTEECMMQGQSAMADVIRASSARKLAATVASDIRDELGYFDIPNKKFGALQDADYDGSNIQSTQNFKPATVARLG